jgi:MoxR-like ATPase|tara:strand:- start:6151 stop:7188 length:1038 start_codon:yes stop_codon:yes gene_type:complete
VVFTLLYTTTGTCILSSVSEQLKAVKGNRVTLKNEEKLASVEVIQESFEKLHYICNPQIATAVFLAYHLEKPILIEGPPGVGKTELAKTAAEMLELECIRLQCYEGLDESKAIYEWKYGKQLLYTQVLKETLNEILEGAKGLSQSVDKLHEFGDIFFSEEFLEPRPLLKALRNDDSCVLLIDEVDKSDHEFESLLLEMLSDFQLSIPEIGTVKAIENRKPLVFLTSNNTREISDALKRRCLHLYIPFPDVDLERKIVQARVPEIAEKLRNQMVTFIQELRDLDLKKVPAISETIDWARTLILLHSESLDPDLVRQTLNVILKFQEDIESVEAELQSVTNKALKEN